MQKAIKRAIFLLAPIFAVMGCVLFVSAATAWTVSYQADDDEVARLDEAALQSCLSVRAIRDHRVPQTGELEFRIKANSHVKVHFRGECKRLKRNSQISYRSVSSKLCRGDEIRTLAPLGGSADVSGICYVKGFSPAAKTQKQ